MTRGGVNGRYHYNYIYNSDNSLKQKIITTPQKKIVISYSFDNLKRLTSYSITDDLFDYKRFLYFKYSVEGQLTEMKIEKRIHPVTNSNLIAEYIFSYSELSMINSIKRTNKQGTIMEEITYVFEQVK